MITMELVERINYLARKQRYEGLTDEEKEEQQKLRRQYLDAIKKQVVDALEGAGHTRKDELSSKAKHQSGCGCGHCKPQEH